MLLNGPHNSSGGGGRLYHHGDCFCKASLRVKLCMISMAENCELAPGKCLSPENK